MRYKRISTMENSISDKVKAIEAARDLLDLDRSEVEGMVNGLFVGAGLPLPYPESENTQCAENLLKAHRAGMSEGAFLHVLSKTGMLKDITKEDDPEPNYFLTYKGRRYGENFHPMGDDEGWRQVFYTSCFGDLLKEVQYQILIGNIDMDAVEEEYGTEL